MIGFAGLSHLGIVSSIATASKGSTVVGHDPNSALCRELNKGYLPIFEPGLAELLADCRSRIRFSEDAGLLKECNLIFFSGDVPTDSDNRSDLSPLRFLIDEVLTQISPGTVLIVMSQVPPGFTRTLSSELAGRHSRRGLQVFYQMEALIFGRAVERALRPERHIIGCDNPEASLPPAYNEWLRAWDCPVLQMEYESAETAKIAVNIYLAASIGVTNMLSELCEAIGADWSEIRPALKLDKRIGPHAYLTPGLGIGGGNIERDLSTASSLASEHNVDRNVLEALISHSRNRRNWVTTALKRYVMSRHPHPTLAIWGLSYKPGTKSTKNSPSISLLESLNGYSIRIYDPQATLAEGQFPWVTQVSSALKACEGAHALIIMTAWEEFASIPASKIRALMSGHVVIDPAAAWDRKKVNTEGLLYCGFGAPPVIPNITA